MFRISLLLLLSAVASMAQDGDDLPDELVSYLELSDAQRRQITQINSGFDRSYYATLERAYSIESEIVDETRKPKPDAMALGLRYLDLEMLRRDLTAEQSRTVEAVQAVLTAAQKQKLATLEAVLQLETTAWSATRHNLLPDPEFGMYLLSEKGPAQVSRAVRSCRTLAPAARPRF